MKRTLSFLICLSLCLGMTACSQGSSSRENKPEESELTVYYTSDDTSAAQIISSYKASRHDVTLNATAFSNVEQMDVQIATETGSGKGPDVILFPKTTTLDTTKMSMSGTFMDLAPMLAQDESITQKTITRYLKRGK